MVMDSVKEQLSAQKTLAMGCGRNICSVHDRVCDDTISNCCLGGCEVEQYARRETWPSVVTAHTALLCRSSTVVFSIQ